MPPQMVPFSRGRIFFAPSQLEARNSKLAELRKQHDAGKLTKDEYCRAIEKVFDESQE